MNIEKYEFFNKLTEFPFVERIYLFGSRARDDNSSRADIDLAIVCPNATDEDWNNILTILDEADTLLQIDCVRFDKIQKEKFKNAILLNNKILFDRRKLG